MKPELSEQNELFLKGYALLIDNQYDNGLSVLNQCEGLFTTPPASIVYDYLSFAYMAKKDNDMAERTLLHGIELGYDNLWPVLANFRRQRSGNSEDYYQTLLSGASLGSISAIKRLIEFLTTSKSHCDYKKAVEYADKLGSSKNNFKHIPDMAICKAIALKNLGQYDESIELLNDLINIGSTSAVNHLCEFYLEKDSPIMDFNKAIGIADKLSTEFRDIVLAEIYTRGSNDPNRYRLIKIILKDAFLKRNFRAFQNIIFVSIFDKTKFEVIYEITDAIFNAYPQFTIKELKEMLIKSYVSTDDQIQKVERYFDDYSDYRNKQEKEKLN